MLHLYCRCYAGRDRHERGDDRERRLAAIERARGTLTGVYDPGYLERLRDDRPA